MIVRLPALSQLNRDISLIGIGYCPHAQAYSSKVLVNTIRWYNLGAKVVLVDTNQRNQHPDRDPQQVGIFKFHASPFIAIIENNFNAFGKSLKVINYQGQEAWGYGAANNYVVSFENLTGDKAYDDTDLHVRLWTLGKHSALTLNDYRTAASNQHRDAWQRLKDSPAYQAGRAERYKIERKFGEAKRWHGFGRCRYVGLLRYGLQAHLTALVLNLKRIVTLLTGACLRPTRRTAPALAV